MSDETATGEDQESEQVGIAQEATGDEHGTGTTSTLTLEAALAEAKAARSEAAKWRRQVRAAEDADRARSEAQMSDAEKSLQRAEAAEARIREYEQREHDRDVRDRVKTIAAAAKVIDPDAVYLMLRDQLADDSDIAALVAALVKAKPYLSPPPLTGASVTGGTQQTEPSKAAPFIRKGGGFFDPAEASRMGGGVFNSGTDAA